MRDGNFLLSIYFLLKQTDVVLRESPLSFFSRTKNLLSRGIICVLRGDESAQRAPKDTNYPEGQQVRVREKKLKGLSRRTTSVC